VIESQLGKVGFARFRKNPEDFESRSEDIQIASSPVQLPVIKVIMTPKTRSLPTPIRKNPEISGKAILIYYEPLNPLHKKCFDRALVEPTSPCPPTTEGRFEQFDL
jgi:hypothetical protein